MNSALRKTTGIGTGLLLVLLTGAPAMADDTELMLVTPDVVVKPNILFMLDTSGSMGSEVRTKEPYNPNEDYGAKVPGALCASDAIYWTDVDIAPSCTSNQHIPKTNFECTAASGPLTGIGSYSDTMVQFRETADPNVKRWQELAAGDPAPVECMSDSGVHGNGNTAGAVYATNNGAQDGFTGDAAQELAWGSAPATVTYTVYDGNYLNWKSSTAEVDVRKIDILKSVTKSVLSSISDVNVGIMRFNGDQGGVVIKAMSDLDADRASILSKVDSLPATGNTPLAEFMYEAALYWRGAPAHFGAGNALTDPAAIDAAGSYIPPGTPVCTSNFNVLLSDGLPQDSKDEAPTLATSLADFTGPCDDTGTGACLDDIAHNLFTVGEDEERVTTYTIGFALDIPSLENTANESGGKYLQADDVETLTTALLQIFSDIDATSMSFTAPSVSVNSFNRTQNLNDLYMAVFSAKGNVHWPGNVKKYRIAEGKIVDAAGHDAVDAGSGFFSSTSQSFWSDVVDGSEVAAGGAAHELPPPHDPVKPRQLFTNDGGVLVDVNTTTVTPAELGLTTAPGEPTHQELIDWMHGLDVRDEDLDGLTTDTRFAMGDPLHSQPAAVVYGGDAADPEVVVFVGTNDGYLHAIDGKDGKELWSFIPAELLDDMNRLFFDPESTFKHYGIDGSIVPVVFDADNDGTIESGDFVRLVFGLRRGGNSYYALDVTDSTSPQLLWAKQLPNSGQSWSAPVIALVDTADTDTGSPTEDAVVIVGDGYDPVHDTPAYPTSAQDARGAGIHILDLATGEPVWRAGPDGSGADLELADMNRSIPTEIQVLDMSGDGYADRMYAADIGGQIWRFDISNGKTASELVEGGVIARLGPEGTGNDLSAPRRFYNSPDVAIFNDPDQGRRFVSISIGSGYRAHPLDTRAPDMFFSVRDKAVFNQLTGDDYDNYVVATIDDLVTVTPGTPAVIGPDKRGWKFELPSNQAILADSLTFADSLFIVAFTPDVNTNNPCEPSAGVNFLYQVNVANGDFAVTNQDAVANGEAEEYVEQLPQGGIAASATPLFPGSTDPDCEGPACEEPPILCVGTVCFDPGFNNDPVRTLWTQDGIQ